MIKLKGRILGNKTHDVGYRVFLLTKAMELGIERFRASNTFEKNVQAVAVYLEADKTAIDEYKDIINSNFPENAEVAEVSFEDYSGYVTSISDYMHLIQVEQLNKGIPAILSIENKQGQMLEKQDVTINVLKSVKEDTSAMLRKQDSMLDKQDATIDVLKSVKEDTSAFREDISMARKDTKDELYEKYEYLSREITEIKSSLSEIKAKVL